MKKTLLVLGVVAAVAAAGFLVYRTYFSGRRYGSVNVEIGSLDERGVAERCRSERGHPRLVCLADELKTTIDSRLLAELQLEYSVAGAQKWSSLPPAGYRQRIGPTLDSFTEEEIAVIKSMLQEAAGNASSEGYDEIEQILNADDFLKAGSAGSDGGFCSGNYHVAFLGTPSATGTWQFYFGGHHLAVGMTYRDGKLIGATPSFRGVEPFEKFAQNGRDNQPLKQEQSAFAAMLGALDENERQTARLAQTFTDLIAGPQRDADFPASPSGIRVGDLSPDKQELVVKALETYVGDVAQPDFQILLGKYRGELADTFVAFSGTTAVDAINDYVRIDGPSVWIEISIQSNVSRDGVHPHSVWRDKKTDYGGNSSR